MEIKNIIVSAVAAFVVSLVAVWGFAPDAQVVTQTVEKQYGALSGPDIISPYLNWGGVRTWNYSMAMNPASTTCSFRSPASTSTLLFAGARVASSTLVAHDAEWGKAITAFATTTSFGEHRSIASGVQYTVLASTTINSQVDGTVVFAPNTYLNLKVGAWSAASPVGNCYAQFVELP